MWQQQRAAALLAAAAADGAMNFLERGGYYDVFGSVHYDVHSGQK